MQKLIGNDHAYKTFAAWTGGGRLPHAILLEGPRGCGKYAFAMQIAQSAVCSGATPPCGECAHCIKAEKNIHPDITTYAGEGKSRSFHIETVREARSKAFLHPNEALSKVIILRNVQDMPVQAQNALLKILEEPPKSVVFILTCENKSALLDTIISRVSALSLRVPSVEAASAYIEEQLPDKAAEEIHLAAVSSGGNIGRALGVLTEGMDTGYSAAVKLWESFSSGNEWDAIVTLSRFERDRKTLENIISLLRDIIATKAVSGGVDQRTSGLLEALRELDRIAAGIPGNVNASILISELCGKLTLAMAR